MAALGLEPSLLPPLVMSLQMPSYMASLPQLTSLLRTPEDQGGPFLQSTEQSELPEL